MTPEELDHSRRHAARMSDAELGTIYVRGPEGYAPEAWEIIEHQVAKRERARRVDRFSGKDASGGVASQADVPEKSAAMAGCLGLALGPVGLWYKRQWAAGFAWLAMAVVSGFSLGIWVAPIFWVGMAIHAAVAETKA